MSELQDRIIYTGRMHHARPKVVYWNNQPSPYVVSRFNAVVERGTIDLEAWFETDREPDRSWPVDPSDWLFPARYIPQRRLGPLSIPYPGPELRAVRPDLLILKLDRMHSLVGSLPARSGAKRLASRTLPTFSAWVPSSVGRTLATSFAYRVLDAAKVPGRDGARYAARYGLPASRIWPVTQSIDLTSYGRHVTSDERAATRTALGLAGCAFVFVGRLWSGKGLDDLFQAFSTIAHSGTSVSLLIIGDGVDELRYRQLAADSPNIVFAGFVAPSELYRYYAACDVLVFPTLGDPNGLVVEEAMAAGLPVITTEAAGDIRERVLPGRTGYVVEPNDPSELAERMAFLAQQPALRRQMAHQSRERAQRYSDAAYAYDFERFVFGTLDTPRRRTASSVAAYLVGQTLMRVGAPEPAPVIQPTLSPTTRAPDELVPASERATASLIRDADALPSFFPHVRPLTTAVLFGDTGLLETAVSPRDWVTECATLIENRLSPFALPMAAKMKHEIPPDVLRQLRAAAFDGSVLTGSLPDSIADGLQALHSHSIPFVIVKGPGLADLYAEPSRRLYSDIDLVVPRGAFREGLRALAKAGYSQRTDNEPPRAYFDPWCREAVNLEHPWGGRVDLHHAVPPLVWGAKFTFDRLYASSRATTFGRAAVQVASPAHNAIIAALHVVSDRDRPGRTLLTWADALIASQAIQPVHLAAEADAVGLAGWLEWVHVSLPLPYRNESLLAELRRYPGAVPHSARLRVMAYWGLAANPRVGHALRLPMLGALGYIFGMMYPSRAFLERNHHLTERARLQWLGRLGAGLRLEEVQR